MDATERERFMKDLRESEERFRILFENSIEAVLTVDLRGTVTSANQALSEMSGYSIDELVGTNYRDLMSQQDAERIYKAYNHLYHTGDPIRDFTSSMIHKTGEIRTAQSYVNVIRRNSEVIGFQATIRDITDRKRVEVALRESEQRLKMAVDAARLGLWDWHIPSDRFTRNDLWFGMLGYSPEEIEPTIEGWKTLVHPDDLTEAERATDDHLAGKTPFYQSEFRMRTRSGDYRWILDRGQVVERDKDGTPIRALGTHIDITEAKKTEEVLKESSERFERLFNAAAVPLCLASKEGILMDFNRRFIETFGYTHEDIPTLREWWQLAYPDQEYRKWVVNTWEAAVKHASEDKTDIEPIEYQVTCKNGEERTMVISGVMLGENFLATFFDMTERKRAEKALRESEVLLKETQKIARVGGWKANPHTDYLEWTEGVYDIIEVPYDYKPGLTEGMKYYPPEYLPVIKDKIAFCLQTGEPFLVEVEVVTETGKRLWTEVRGLAPIVEGQRSYVVGTFQDITERRNAEEALRQSEAKYRELIEDAIDLIFLVDLEGNFLEVNESLLKETGYSEKELLSINFIEFVHPDDMNIALLAYEKGRSGEPYEFEMRGKKKDGSYGWYSFIIRPILDKEGKPAHVHGIARNITEKKQTEEALRISEEKYRQVIENAQESIMIIVDGVVQYANPLTEKSTGYTLEELKSKSILELIHPENHDGIMKEYFRKLTGDPFTYPSEFKYTTKTGETRWYESVAISISWEGKPALLTFARDVTDRKKMERQLLQSQKMEAIGSMAGGIAHNFNNILVGIMGYSEYLLNKRSQDDPEYKALKTIFDGTIKASQLTRQLLNVTKAGEYQLKPCDMNSIVERVLPLIMGTFDKSIEIKTNLGVNLPNFDADSSPLEQCLLNLCINARDALPSGGNIIIETCVKNLDDDFVRTHVGSQAGMHLVLSVSDNGFGMPQEVKDRIFEPFYSTKTEHEGTGMGLATVYGTVKKHGGFITVYSEPGEGTTFRLYFPVTRGGITEDQYTSKEVDERGHETILIIDDEKVVRDIWMEHLKSAGYNVVIAEDGEKGVALFMKQNDLIDLIILDVIMPKMGGGDVLKRIREIDPHVKILIASGYSESGRAGEVITEGVNGFIQKPTTLKELSEKVRGILDGI